MIRLGYACINTVLPSPGKNFRLANYTEQKMLMVAKENLDNLRHILNWNLKHKIYLFRLTSSLIPFGSNQVNSGSWKKEWQEDFAELGQFIHGTGMQVSMHPGQYTVLNSPTLETVQSSIAELSYHADILNLLGLDSSHHIIIHVGGGYGHKELAIERFKKQIEVLDPSIRIRLALENDESVFTAEEILELSCNLGLPAVFDVLHHELLPSFFGKSLPEIIQLFQNTWPVGERQKIHYSQQAKDKSIGAHSLTIDPRQFADFYGQIKDLELDIMLEAKDKQESLLKLREAIPKLG